MYGKPDEKSHIWLQGNIEPKKLASIVAVQEQMVETRASKANIGLPLKRDKCRICRQTKETVRYWFLGCARLSTAEYLIIHKNALIILCVALGIQEELLGKNTKWCKER